jgi:hypothetical protein
VSLVLVDYMACAADWQGTCPGGPLVALYDLAAGVEVAFRDGSTDFFNVLREEAGDAFQIGPPPVGS